MRARLGSIVVVSVVVGGAACGGLDRPAPEGDPSASSDSALEPGFIGPERAAPRRICEPGATRLCRITYVDHNGRLHCPARIQRCRFDGLAWSPCGVDDAGAPDADAQESAAEDDDDVPPIFLR